jgi:hypothetical protein
MIRLAVFALLLASALSPAADLTAIDRTIPREPAYAGKSPRYALLVLGPGARDRVWLVKDGDTLYVDRNGNGDLTEPGEKVAARKGSSDEKGYTFEVGEITPGGTKHTNVMVFVDPLRRLLHGEYARRADMQAALKRDPQADVLHVALDATLPHLKPKGAVRCAAGGLDLDGPLLLAAKPAEAPVVHVGGPLEVTFFDRRPALRRGRPSELVFAVGSRGLGPGTFAAILYEETIPKDVHPVAEITFPPARAGGEPVKKRFEFKERC